MLQTRRYKVLSILGQGGFGTVYRARLTGEGGFSKPVALKVLNPELSATGELARRLRDEARVLGLVQHRAIVKVDALVPLNGRWTVVMEYVEGRDIKTILERGPIPLGAALEIASEIAGALHAAYHATGPDGAPLRLLHRDIKPANVCVTALGEVKVLDFGIARAEFSDREASTQSQAFGTPDYMAPERFLFENGPESDIYALGATLYEMLLGRPFGRASANQGTHNDLIAGRLDLLRGALGPAHEDAVALLSELLAYEPERRPSARDVERRLTLLRHSKGDLLLRDWAEGVLPPLVLAQEQRADGSTGTQLVEGGEPAASSESRPNTWPASLSQPESLTYALQAEAPQGSGPTLVAPALEESGSQARSAAPSGGASATPRPGPGLPRGAVLGVALIAVIAAALLLVRQEHQSLDIQSTKIEQSAPATPDAASPAISPVPATLEPSTPAASSTPSTPATASTPAPSPASAPVASAPVSRSSSSKASPATSTSRADPPESGAQTSAAAASSGGIAGSWQGTLGGQAVDLTLRGDGGAVRGRIVVYGGGGDISNDVKGSFDATSRTLTLMDTGDVPDASGYSFKLSDDGRKLSGAATPVGTSTQIRMILSRSGS